MFRDHFDVRELDFDYAKDHLVKVKVLHDLSIMSELCLAEE